MPEPRRITRATWVALALVCLALGVAACGRGPVETTLEELSRAPEHHDGRRVIVTGTLRGYADPEHYWIENAALDRVGLEGDVRWRALVGWTVEVRGVFHYDRRAGRRIRVEAIADAR